VIVADAVGLLDDDFAFEAGEVGELEDLFLVHAGEDAGGAEGEGGGGAGADHGGFGAEEFGDAFADGVVEFTEADEVLGGVVDGVHDFGLHERGGEHGVGASRVDERADAQVFEVVAFGGRGGGGGREAGDGGGNGKGFQEFSAVGHLAIIRPRRAGVG